MRPVASTIEMSELSQEQQDLVRDTLRSILDSSLFSKSKRYPALLEYLVRHALNGDTSVLKERCVGTDVFGRPPGYEPATDPIVRVAVGEVRRRIAVYYSEHPDAPVRIDFPLGQYTAVFHFRPAMQNTLQEPAPAAAQELVEVQVQPLHAKSHPVAWSAAVAVALLLSAGTAVWQHVHAPSKRDFWSPVFNNSVPALIVLGEAAQASDAQRWAQPVSNDAGFVTTHPGGTSMANAATAAQMCNIFRTYGRSCELISATKADLTNLRSKTAIFIGRDNDWTHNILAPLRYRFQSETGVPNSFPQESIADQTSSADDARVWKNTGRAQTYTDYAVAARFHSDITDGTAVVEAGLTSNGTLGAAQFLASSENIDELLAQAPKTWKGFNFEAVLQIDVVQGAPGHVKVVASQFW